MTIDLEALAYALNTVIDFEPCESGWTCHLRGILVKEIPGDLGSMAAISQGYTRESAADNLTHLLRGKIVLGRTGKKEFFHVPTTLFAGIK